MNRDSYRAKVLDSIPTSWLDPLLTGPDAVLKGYEYSPKDIVRLLVAIRARIEAIPYATGRGS